MTILWLQNSVHTLKLNIHKSNMVLNIKLRLTCFCTPRVKKLLLQRNFHGISGFQPLQGDAWNLTSPSSYPPLATKHEPIKKSGFLGETHVWFFWVRLHVCCHIIRLAEVGTCTNPERSLALGKLEEIEEDFRPFFMGKPGRLTGLYNRIRWIGNLLSTRHRWFLFYAYKRTVLYYLSWLWMAVLSQAVDCMVGHPCLSHDVEVEGVLVLFKLPGCFQTCWNWIERTCKTVPVNSMQASSQNQPRKWIKHL